MSPKKSRSIGLWRARTNLGELPHIQLLASTACGADHISCIKFNVAMIEEGS